MNQSICKARRTRDRKKGQEVKRDKNTAYNAPKDKKQQTTGAIERSGKPTPTDTKEIRKDSKEIVPIRHV
jgi:hypothetical protein